MRVVSLVYDHFKDKYPMIPQVPYQPYIAPITFPAPIFPVWPTQQEIDDFRKDMLEMKLLLIRAREYDKKNNQPDCETASKKETLKKIAEAFGVDISFVDQV